MGRLFAATRESPGELVTLPRAKVPARFQSIINGEETYEFKRYRGMGSIGAMKKGKEVSSEEEYHGKDFQAGTVLHAEGVEGLVPCSGNIGDVVDEMIEGLKSGMYYTGNDTLEKLRSNATFHFITTSSLTESHPHDIYVESTATSYAV
jgi:IMP dehydrogenase